METTRRTLTLSPVLFLAACALAGCCKPCAAPLKCPENDLAFVQSATPGPVDEELYEKDPKCLPPSAPPQGAGTADDPYVDTYSFLHVHDWAAKWCGKGSYTTQVVVQGDRFLDQVACATKEASYFFDVTAIINAQHDPCVEMDLKKQGKHPE